MDQVRLTLRVRVAMLDLLTELLSPLESHASF